MTDAAERHRRLGRLFAEVLELADDDRDIWLAGLESTETVADLRALLQATGGTSRIQRPVVESLEALRLNYEAGEEIGPFLLESLLGRGGMGEVWMASQSEPIQRKVALKILPGTADDELARARFVVERQALARLNHRAVAKIYEAGITRDGAWVAMELIDGRPLTVAADDRCLGLAERARWLAEVASGVHHAHGLGVFHRDLKASNVLLSTVDGQPKVIDFGIARLDDELAAGTLSGTPDTMSPEQIRGHGSDDLSDVYALGLLLFELMVGVPPWTQDHRRRRLEDPDSVPIPKAIERLEDVEPELRETAAAQRGLSPAGHRRALSGEIEWILGACLARSPDLRYSSAAALADDLRRFLEGRPIDAGPSGAAYRLRCFVRRNRVGSLLSGLVLVALVTGMVGVTLEGERARRAAAESNRAREEADEVVRFLVSALHHADPGRGDPTASEILQQAAETLRTEPKPAPHTRSRIHMVLGDIYRQKGHLELAEAQFLEALTTRRDFLGRDDALVGTTLDSLALIDLDRGRVQEAIERFAQALKVLEGELDPGHVWIAQVHSNRAIGLMQVDRLDEAEADLNQAVVAYKALEEVPWRELARALNNLGSVSERRNDMEEAERFYTEALEIRREHLPSDDPDLTGSANNLAIIAKRSGRIERARELYGEALDQSRRVWGPAHDRVAICAFNLALLELDNNGLKAAGTLFAEAASIFENNHGRGHPHFLLVSFHQARAMHQSGKSPTALEILTEIAATEAARGACDRFEAARDLIFEISGESLSSEECPSARTRPLAEATRPANAADGD